MPDPMYRQIAEDLRQKIETGELRAGSQLPTQLEFSESNNASRNTVRDAVRWLISRGLVETRPGHGTFVGEKIDPFVLTIDVAHGFGVEAGTAFYESEVKAGHRTPTVDPPRIEIHKAAGVISSELQLAEGTVFENHRTSYDESGKPLRFAVTSYPADRNQFVATSGQVPLEIAQPTQATANGAERVVR